MVTQQKTGNQNMWAGFFGCWNLVKQYNISHTSVFMANTGKILSVFFTLVFAVSLLLSPVVALDAPKPSVPQFTVKLVDLSYDIPAYNSTDPYTGQTVTNPAQHVENRTLEFKVKNQPFTPYYDAESTFTINLYYNIRMRGHYDIEGNWTTLFHVDGYHPIQSDTEYTIISLPLGSHSDTPFQWLSSESNSELDFQVEAMIGYFGRTMGFASWYFKGEESSWSSTQTVTIPPANQPSPTASPSQGDSGNQTPTAVDWVQAATLGLLAAIVVLLALVVLYLRKRAAATPR